MKCMQLCSCPFNTELHVDLDWLTVEKIELFLGSKRIIGCGLKSHDLLQTFLVSTYNFSTFSLGTDATCVLMGYLFIFHDLSYKSAARRRFINKETETTPEECDILCQMET